jgi:dynein heavy chain
MPSLEPLSFEPNGEISAMVSVEGEEVPLVSRIRPAAANGAVEKWLVQVGEMEWSGKKTLCSYGTIGWGKVKREQPSGF